MMSRIKFERPSFSTDDLSGAELASDSKFFISFVFLLTEHLSFEIKAINVEAN